jgi:hypothetical protein
MLFSIVDDILAIMIEHAQADGPIEGVILMEHDLEKARHLKLILSGFEKLSGLKINFHKSKFFYFGEAQDEAIAYVGLFGCGQGQFPMRYLGIPIHYKRLTNAEWKLVEGRLQKRLSSWKGKLLSLGGRLILINLVLPNMYYI